MKRKIIMWNLFCSSTFFLTNVISCGNDIVMELEYKEGKNNIDVVNLLKSNQSHLFANQDKIEIGNGILEKDYFNTDLKVYFDEYGREIIEDEIEGTLIFINGQSTSPNEQSLSHLITDIFIGLDTYKNQLNGSIYDGNFTNYTLSIKGKKQESKLELFVLKLNYIFNSEYSRVKGVKFLKKDIPLT